MSLAGNTLFITGASRGIGKAIALRAARDSANVAIVAIVAKTEQPHPRLPGTIYSAAGEIEAAGGRALPMPVDIRDDTKVAEAAKRCTELLRRHRSGSWPGARASKRSKDLTTGVDLNPRPTTIQYPEP